MSQLLPGTPVAVVTRPLKQAGMQVQGLQEIGYQVVGLPLLGIAASPEPQRLQECMQALEQYRLVVFVSPNAVHSVKAYLPAAWPAGVMIGVVGQGSLQALADCGVTREGATIYCPEASTDSEGLLDLLPMAALAGQKVLVVRGQDGRPFLTEVLQAAGVQVEHVAAYQRLPLVPDAGQATMLCGLVNQPAVYWIVTSSEALRHLVSLVRQYAGENGVVKLQQQSVVATHSRIATVAQSLGFYTVLLAGSGDEQVIAKLQSLL